MYTCITESLSCIAKINTHCKSVRVCAQLLRSVRLFATLWTVARQAPLFMGFSRQEYWSGLPFPPPGDFPDPWKMGMGPVSLTSPALAGEFFTTSATWEPHRGLGASAWQLSGKGSTCHHRRHGFDSWSGKIPHAAVEPKPVHQRWSLGAFPGCGSLSPPLALR